jgi:Metal-dependent hydrolase
MSDVTLRLLSYNIQAGLATRDYGHYVTGAWRHALPARGRRSNLARMAELMQDYDFVALQEADAGSLRTGDLNQIEYLAQRAGFQHYGYSVMRDLAPVARVSLGYLSRWRPRRVVTHLLPGRIPGRGALEVELVSADGAPLRVLATHLSLGPGSRRRQLDYLAAVVAESSRAAVLVGDLNSSSESLRRHPGLRTAGLEPVAEPPVTYPSWRPERALDQVLVRAPLEVLAVRALPVRYSDHRPLAVDLGRCA